MSVILSFSCRRRATGAVVALLVALASAARAHDMAVIVNKSQGRLTTNRHLYYTMDPENGLSPFDMPSTTTIPGFDVMGGTINATDQLYLHVLGNLWYSDGTTVAPAGPETLNIVSNFWTLGGAGTGSIGSTMTSTTGTATVTGISPLWQPGLPFRSDGLFLDAHAHYFTYEFIPGNDRVGAYGLMVEISSDRATASEPFLITFNRGLDDAALANATSAMYQAALFNGLPGDVNRDSRVDRTDLTELTASLGGGSLRGDFDGDGAVGLRDLQLLQYHWSGSASSSAAAVPEPTTASLLLSGVAVLCLTRRMRRRPCA